MMQLYFNAVSEPTQAGAKWQQLFNTYWPAYRAWLKARGADKDLDLEVAQTALKTYMPEMLPNYERFCHLAGSDPLAARFLTGYNPPAYISGCAQAVLKMDEIRLVRNYDYHPTLMEGTLLLSAWNGKRVIANSDCLIGALDGMNENGLAISLTFGGRKVVGKGFGIPFILRYVLEFCNDVSEAVAALVRIPSHMSYNVTVIDRRGRFKTVYLAPDRRPLITNTAFSTNHQGIVEWPENAAFNRTVERANFLKRILSDKALDAESAVRAFLQPPLYNTQFAESFGTLYTVVYSPAEGSVQVRWPNDSMLQTLNGFREENKLISFQHLPAGPGSKPIGSPGSSDIPETTPSDQAADRKTATRRSHKYAKPDGSYYQKLAHYWSGLGKEFWKKWW